MRTKHLAIIAVVCVAFTHSASAQTGPVASACKADIAKYCANLGHGNRQTRTCLEANKAKVSQACKTALETTGRGRGRRSGMLSVDEVTVALKQKGYSDITKIERESGGRFEVMAKDSKGVRVELYVDGRTGSVLRSERDD